ncbi:MAG TPA: hypothetical protein ENK25_01870 [Bacteroidetes bacterium]|nr:hypothetical protein [Bacteroidota bacterium]
MDKLKLKEEIIRICLEKQEKVIQTAKQAILDIQESANEDDQTRDLYDPYRTQLLSKRDLLASQYEKALQDKQILEKLTSMKSRPYVDVGSVVITDKQKMFVSIGLGKFTCCNETYYAISPKVPLFNVIQGLRKGDTYEFNGQQVKVLDVF